MLTADQIDATRFTVTRLTDGYEMDAVDQLLDRIAGTLRGYAEANGAAVELLADDVAASVFPTTRFRKGYVMEEVDNFLDEAVAALRSHEHAA